MQRFVRFAVCAAALIYSSLPTASYAGVIDQQNTGTASIGLSPVSGDYFAESFTVGQTGLLDRVDLQVAQNEPGTISNPLFVELRRTLVTGAPDLSNGALLASATLVSSDLTGATYTNGPMIQLPLGDQSVPVSTGQVLALCITTQDGPQFPWYVWGAKDFNSYAGKLFIKHPSDSAFSEQTNRDFLFRTYVATPEPASVALLALGSLGLLRRRLA